MMNNAYDNTKGNDMNAMQLKKIDIKNLPII